MADINCGICAEPWENYELKQEFNAETGNWDDLKAVLGDKVADSKMTPYKWFMKGNGCPACKMGANKPIFPEQQWKAKHEFYDHASMLKIKADDVVTIVQVDYRSGDSFNPPVNVRREDGTEIAIKEKEFYQRFELVPSGKDQERAEEIRLDAAKSACNASDEDPIGILQDRGIF